MSAAIEASVQAIRSIQLWVTIAALVLAPLFFGSVDSVWVALWAVVLSLGTLCGVAKPMSGWQQRILYVFLGLCGAYALVATIQIVPHLIAGLDDPIWQRASHLLGVDLPPRISSRAEIPPMAIGHFLLVVTSFLSGFFVGTSRRDADSLMVFARFSILAYAIYGLLALVFTPNLLLWAPKTAYRASLTATFVNHNTAATFVGMGTILWLCVAFATLQSLQSSSLRLLLLTPSNEQLTFKLILRAAAGLVCFIALLLTGSRGGLIFSCLGLLVAIGLMIATRIKARFWYLLSSAGAALAVTLSWLGQAGRIGSEGLLDNGRWSVYGYCIEAIRQRPLLGAGVGTFADLFPSARGSDLNVWGVWDYAHSTILEIAVEMGIPIAVMIALAGIASVFILMRAALSSKDRGRSSFAAVSGIAVLGYLHSSIDFSLQIPGFLIVFWILVGCWLAQSSPEELPVRRASMRRFIAEKSTAEAQEPVAADAA